MNPSCASEELDRKLKAKSFFNKAVELENTGKSDEAVKYYKAAFKLDANLERGDVDYEENEFGDDNRQEQQDGTSSKSSPTASLSQVMSRLTKVDRSTLPPGYRTFDARQLLVSEENSSQDASTPSRVTQQVREYFESEGYVVLDNCLDQNEIDEALSYFGQFLARAIESAGGKDDSSTSNNVDAANFNDGILVDPRQIIASRISTPGNGIVAKYGAGQSRFNWFIRSRPTVKQSFRTLLFDDHDHDDEEEEERGQQSAPSHARTSKKMITSFDGFNFIINEESHDEGGGVDASWLHFDATGFKTANYLQGLVNLLDSTPETEPSFVVLPKSHRTVFPFLLPGPGYDPCDGSGIHFLTKTDILRMGSASELNVQERPFRVPLRPGSLVIWKSSTLHCSIGCSESGRAEKDRNPKQIFRRVASYVGMMKDPMDDEVTKNRIEQKFRLGVTTGHQPDYGRVSSGPAPALLKSCGVVIVDEKDLFAGALELL